MTTTVVPSPPPRTAATALWALPPDLDLRLLSRRPPVLRDRTARAVAEAPVPVASAAATSPRASIVVVTHNGLLFTKMCLAAVLLGPADEPFELVVVDNASTDGTADYLRAVAGANPHVRLILNDTNRGFAAANNQALGVARGELLVLLNNDTIPPPHWLSRLVAHLRDASAGLVGPVTNRIGNEAEIPADYCTYGEMLDFAAARAADFAGNAFDLPVPCMFCLAMRRDVFETLGPLDERFEIGLLEDDDYARRARAAGYRTVGADDTFVHHFGQGSFGELVPTGEYARLLEVNQRRYREKWGEPWQPYGRRAVAEYQHAAECARSVVRDVLPRGAVVAVVSRGDEELLRFDGKTGRHFPATDDGTYAGHYPADGAEAIAWLERARRSGAEYFLVPPTARWWLEHYADFAQHLRERYDLLLRREEAGELYSLLDAPGGAAPPDRAAPPPIGSRDYRAFVGPPDKYDLVGANQFSLLVALGLREHHALLDVGCGSLRAGRLFLAYLLPERYFAIEPQEWLVREGVERELGADVLRVKRPRFSIDRDFTLGTFGRPMDFIVAQSIFSHAALSQVRRCLAEAAKVMRPRAVFAVTFCEGAEDYAGDDWVYPGCVTYTFDRLRTLAREQGLEAVRLAWPHPNGQQWVAFFRPLVGSIPEALLQDGPGPDGGGA